MTKTMVAEEEAVRSFANFVDTDFLVGPKSLRYVIERMVDFYEKTGVINATDQLLLASCIKRPRIPRDRIAGFFDLRTEDIDWAYASVHDYQMVEIRRYIQLGRGENDTSLDCKLYFPHQASDDLAIRAYVEIFEHENVLGTIEKFLQHSAVKPLLDRNPDYFLGFATIVW